MRRLQWALGRIERDRRRPEAEQRKRAEAVITALADIPAAILIANDRGRYVDVNHAASLLTGYSRRELLQMSVWDLTPAIRQALGRRLWRDFLARGRMAGVYQIRCKDGRIGRPSYVAAAHVLPGLHLSALVSARVAPRARARARGTTEKRSR